MSCNRSRAMPPTADGRMSLPEQGLQGASRSHVPATHFPPAPRSAAALLAAAPRISRMLNQHNGRFDPPVAPLSHSPSGAGQNKVHNLTVLPHQGQLPAGVAGLSTPSGFIDRESGSVPPVSTRDLCARRRELKAQRAVLRTELNSLKAALRLRREASHGDRGRSAYSAGSTALSIASATPAQSASKFSRQMDMMSPQIPLSISTHRPPPTLRCASLLSTGATGPFNSVTPKPVPKPSYSAWPAYDSDSDSSSGDTSAVHQDDDGTPPLDEQYYHSPYGSSEYYSTSSPSSQSSVSSPSDSRGSNYDLSGCSDPMDLDQREDDVHTESNSDEASPENSDARESLDSGEDYDAGENSAGEEAYGDDVDDYNHDDSDEGYGYYYSDDSG